MRGAGAVVMTTCYPSSPRPFALPPVTISGDIWRRLDAGTEAPLDLCGARSALHSFSALPIWSEDATSAVNRGCSRPFRRLLVEDGLISTQLAHASDEAEASVHSLCRQLPQASLQSNRPRVCRAHASGTEFVERVESQRKRGPRDLPGARAFTVVLECAPHRRKRPPVYGSEIVTSIRRFWARPSSVSLLASGRDSP